MPLLRPIGHIACNLQILAISVAYRVRLAPSATSYACWVDDDGCVYLALSAHPRATSMQRHAPEQRINTYRKPKAQPFPLTADDIVTDLQDARVALANRSLRQASAEAVPA